MNRSIGWHVRDFARQHPIWFAFIALVGLGVLVQYWWFFAVVAALGVGVKVIMRRREQAAVRAQQERYVVERAH